MISISIYIISNLQPLMQLPYNRNGILEVIEISIWGQGVLKNKQFVIKQIGFSFTWVTEGAPLDRSPNFISM